MKIFVDIEGEFESRNEAANAIYDVSCAIRRGEYSAQCKGDQNPTVFVIEQDDDDED